MNMSNNNTRDSLCPISSLSSQSFLNLFLMIHKQQQAFSKILYHMLSGEWVLWLFKLTMTILRLIHLVTYINSMFICIVGCYSIVWIYHNCFFILSAISGYLCCFQFWAITNKAAVKICVHVKKRFAQPYDFISTTL